MQILPVLDLMQGQVVRGVAGRRAFYRPVQSGLAADARPATVAAALAGHFRFRQAYVADLDAIHGAPAADGMYHEMAEQGLRLWVDAGLSGVEDAKKLADLRPGGHPLVGVIAGLETIDLPDLLPPMLAAVGVERFVFSLDMDDGVPRTDAPAWHRMNAWQIATCAVESGVRRIILLDLRHVGVGAGVGTLRLCQQLRQQWPEIELTSGGGVRDADDLRSLERAGCDYALVASALHDGGLHRLDCQRYST